MPSRLEVELQRKAEKREREIVYAIERDLVEAVAHAGGVLRGFSVKIEEFQVSITLRAELVGTNQVSFVYSDDLGSCLIKAVRMARRDALRWKADKWVKNDV